MIDRGFVKWQPFNSLVPLKDTIVNIENKEKCAKPGLFPEEMSMINDALIEAYYTQDFVSITYYKAGKIKIITSNIKKINPSSKIIELGCGEIVSFFQILHIASSSE